MLPDFCLHKIATIQPPSDDLGSDSIGWHWDSKRIFTSKSTYSRLVQHPGDFRRSIKEDVSLATLLLRWQAPQEGLIKINTDAAVARSDRLTTIGGVFRDHTGKWIFGFYWKIGVSTVLIAELWVIHNALRQAWDRGLCKINLESDCLDTVRILNGQSTSLLGNGLVATILNLLRYDWTVSINHINRVCNGVADRLATLSKANGIDDLQFLEPLAEVLRLM
ncbi:hypothetical protein V6N11_008347 [Hibiscus sabdariffa]|uniref:RNase H type-1 domain-containing protein n=1 Tax=Hibiscus sabdariffa TaxID=183260 RepID=A0ABR1ZBC3_9ROSI